MVWPILAVFGPRDHEHRVLGTILRSLVVCELRCIISKRIYGNCTKRRSTSKPLSWLWSPRGGERISFFFSGDIIEKMLNKIDSTWTWSFRPGHGQFGLGMVILAWAWSFRPGHSMSVESQSTSEGHTPAGVFSSMLLMF